MIRKLSTLVLLGMLFVGCVQAEDAVSQTLKRYETASSLDNQRAEIAKVTVIKTDPAMKKLSAAQQKLFAGAVDDIKIVITDAHTAYRDLTKVYGVKGWSEAFKNRINGAIADMQKYAAKLQEREKALSASFADATAEGLRKTMLEKVSEWYRTAEDVSDTLQRILKDAKTAAGSVVAQGLRKTISAEVKALRYPTSGGFSKSVLDQQKGILKSNVENFNKKYAQDLAKLPKAEQEIVGKLQTTLEDVLTKLFDVESVVTFWASCTDQKGGTCYADEALKELRMLLPKWRENKKALQSMIDKIQPTRVKSGAKELRTAFVGQIKPYITLNDESIKTGERLEKDLQALIKLG